MLQIGDCTYVETAFRGSNDSFVVTPEGIVMIDTPQRPTDAAIWIQEINKHGEVRYLINTEPHPDHYATNSLFPGVVIAHQDSAKAMKARPLDQVIDRVREMDTEGWKQIKKCGIRLPSITFTQVMEVLLGGYTFRLINLPGHTESETAVFLVEERVLFTGDNVVYQTKNFLTQAVPDKWLNSLKIIGDLDVNIIVPGHGDKVCDKSYLNQQASIISGWIDIVKTSIKKGWTKEEALARISCPDPYPMPKGREAMANEVDKMNINRLYSLYATG